MSPLEQLVALLELEPLEVNLFRGQSPPDSGQRVFGGQVAAQALAAAGYTVDADRVVHSLHSYFLLPGDPSTPIVFEVDRIRDGRSFTTRRVVAIQHGRPIFNLAASFQVAEPGPEHQDTMPPVAEPDDLPTWQEWVEPVLDRVDPGVRRWLMRPRGVEKRISGDVYGMEDSSNVVRQMWMRADGRLPDDDRLHQCILTYASDLRLLDVATLPHVIGPSSGEFQLASIDHAMWFHRPFRADEWLLYHQESPSASGKARSPRAAPSTRTPAPSSRASRQEGLVRPARPGYQLPAARAER